MQMRAAAAAAAYANEGGGGGGDGGVCKWGRRRQRRAINGALITATSCIDWLPKTLRVDDDDDDDDDEDLIGRKRNRLPFVFFLLSFFVFFCHLLRKPKTSAETESIKKITQKKGKKRNGGSKYQVERIASASCKLSLDSFRLITELSSRCFVTYGRHSFFCFVSFCLF